MALQFFEVCFAIHAGHGGSTATAHGVGVGVNWRVVAVSVIGTSHIASGTTCQDSCLAYVDSSQGNQPLLSIFVADGAGSAAHGGDGAELAIEVSAAFISEKYALPNFEINHELAVGCVSRIRDRIYDHAIKCGRTPRDYACTFLAVLSSLKGTLIMQIGDGGIVIDVGNGLEVPVIPMSGEYANMTHFVTDDDAINILATKTFYEKATKVAVFTDGIQRLALNMVENTAYEPFFAPFFKVLLTATADQEEELRSALAQFLNSDAVNERTDDDKTLALAVMLD